MFCNFPLLIFVSNEKKINGPIPFMAQEKIQIKNITLPVELVVFIDVTVGNMVYEPAGMESFSIILFLHLAP